MDSEPDPQGGPYKPDAPVSHQRSLKEADQRDPHECREMLPSTSPPKTALMMKRSRSHTDSPATIATGDDAEVTPPTTKKIKVEPNSTTPAPVEARPAPTMATSRTATTGNSYPTVSTGPSTTTSYPTTGVSGRSRGRIRLPDKLMEYLQKNVLPDTLWWHSDGDGFVFDTVKLQTNFLDRYFKGTKLSSFIRSLNRWGFRRVFYHSLPDGSLAFHHDLFRRNDPERIRDMAMVSYTPRPRQRQEMKETLERAVANGRTSPDASSQGTERMPTSVVVTNPTGSVSSAHSQPQQQQPLTQDAIQMLAQNFPNAQQPTAGPGTATTQNTDLQQALALHHQQQQQQQQQQSNLQAIINHVLTSSASAAVHSGNIPASSILSALQQQPAATTSFLQATLAAALANGNVNNRNLGQDLVNRVLLAQQQQQVTSDPAALLRLLQIQQLQQQQQQAAPTPVENTALLLLLQQRLAAQQQQQQEASAPASLAALLQLLQGRNNNSSTVDPARLLQLVQNSLQPPSP